MWTETRKYLRVHQSGRPLTGIPVSCRWLSTRLIAVEFWNKLWPWFDVRKPEPVRVRQSSLIDRHLWGSFVFQSNLKYISFQRQQKHSQKWLRSTPSGAGWPTVLAASKKLHVVRVVFHYAMLEGTWHESHHQVSVISAQMVIADLEGTN